MALKKKQQILNHIEAYGYDCDTTHQTTAEDEPATEEPVFPRPGPIHHCESGMPPKKPVVTEPGLYASQEDRTLEPLM